MYFLVWCFRVNIYATGLVCKDLDASKKKKSNRQPNSIANNGKQKRYLFIALIYIPTCLIKL